MNSKKPVASKEDLVEFFKKIDIDLVEKGNQLALSKRGDRQRMQHIIYLAQAFGIDLGYKFTWYLY